MKTLYLSIFIITIFLLAYLLTDEKNLKEREYFSNIELEKENIIDYFRCRIIDKSEIDSNNCRNITRIAFGSCNNHYKNQKYWRKILEYNPNLWIWLGDNIYSDYFPKEYTADQIKSILNDKTRFKNHMDNQYVKLVKNKYYQEILDSEIEITGIWDDHDYYQNNKGKYIDYDIKKFSRDLFFDFINFNKDRNNMEYPADNKGIYRTFNINSNENLVKIFLLDVRTFKTNNDILGTKQWKWLRRELNNSQAKLNLICSGLQVISERNDYESWTKIGNSKDKLLKIIKCTGKNNTIILSGDIHQSCIKSSQGLFEITASPLSNFISKYKYKNKNNIGDYLRKNNFGFMDIHWNPDKTKIIKIITGFRDVKTNKIYNVLEIK